jgi:hypothetical protein
MKPSMSNIRHIVPDAPLGPTKKKPRPQPKAKASLLDTPLPVESATLSSSAASSEVMPVVVSANIFQMLKSASAASKPIVKKKTISGKATK